MYDKKKCKTCKYHGNMSGMYQNGTWCNYSGLSNDGTCLKRVGDEVIDRRGGDSKNCLLYEKGKPKRV